MSFGIYFGLLVIYVALISFGFEERRLRWFSIALPAVSLLVWGVAIAPLLVQLCFACSLMLRRPKLISCDRYQQCHLCPDSVRESCIFAPKLGDRSSSSTS